jgi:large subunit ribosomal protein L31
MKTDIHPKYAPVVFRDLASGATFLTRSTVSSSKTIVWEDGKEYAVIDVEISSESHPFYTGKQRIMDSAGRVEKFNSRYAGFGTKKYQPPDQTRGAPGAGGAPFVVPTRRARATSAGRRRRDRVRIRRAARARRRRW